jgi:hypothetical protein
VLIEQLIAALLGLIKGSEGGVAALKPLFDLSGSACACSWVFCARSGVRALLMF